ncbi:outer membrane lipoprotein-sorting protein [Flavobacterium sp. H122]|uniref:outer membrane lipoprotein-sorting protein n=1 Tax=Flavobacterium sp. H122 TaxID=2529860 RepID=UPI0010A99ED9|nr:outer membrane lipoprotein-sorting protein [Flavobacterium sp. H122]
MKILKIVAVALLGTFAAYAQSADEVINNYVKTVGGTEKLNSLKGLRMEMVANYGGMEIPVNVVTLKGGKMYVVVNVQGKEIKQMASDGIQMWSTNMMTQKAEKLDAEANENAKLSNQDFPDALLDYKSKGYKVEFLGKETKEGTECFKIKLSKKPIKIGGVSTADETFYYFDTENFLPIVTETEIKQGPMKGQKSVSKMSDYQEVEGLYFPFSINQFGSDMKVKKITLNPVVEDKEFAFPVN